jgi:hypothetical protein
MYQITGNTVSFRVNDAERDQFNQIAAQLQESENEVYANGNHVFFALLRHCRQLENSSLENKFHIPDSALEKERETAVNRVNEIRTQLITAVNEDDNVTDDELITLVINKINKEPETKTETVTEIKEVEKQLAENQIVIEVTERKLEILQEIAKRRAKKYRLEQLESLPVLAEKMIFNDGTVFNLSGELYTGF